MRELAVLVGTCALITLIGSIYFVWEQQWIPGIYLVLFAQYLRHESVIAGMLADYDGEEEE